jgi:hypothetical protein
MLFSSPCRGKIGIGERKENAELDVGAERESEGSSSSFAHSFIHSFIQYSYTEPSPVMGSEDQK